MKPIFYGWRWGPLAAAVLLISLWVVGCGKSPKSGAVIARAGSLKLTQSEFEMLTGVPMDSLAPADRRRLVESWVERALVEQEGERLRLDNHPDVKQKLDALRAEVYRARLLAQIPAPLPEESAVAEYYDRHSSEFLRPNDAYLIELYWSEDRTAMAAFRGQIQHGDTSLLSEGQVFSEGKWLAERGEMDSVFEAEVLSLKPGEVTFPRPYEDGFRVARLLESFPAGTVLDLPAVHDEIQMRLMTEQGRARADSLENDLRSRYPVTIYLPD